VERNDGPLSPALAEARFTSQRAQRRRIEGAYASGARSLLRAALLGIAALLLHRFGPALPAPFVAALGWLVAVLSWLAAALGVFGGVRLFAAFALSRRAAA
jgi:hypothetical protein